MSNAKLVQDLRERTGAGFMDCKTALVECRDDMEKAIDFLRKKGLASALKKAGRAANEGRIQSYIHSNGKIGVLVEVNCETDFVAKTDDFQSLVYNIAMHVAAANPRFLDEQGVPADVVEREKSIFRQQAEESGKKGPVVDKIAEGKLGKFFQENCLLKQAYVKDPDKSIDDVVKEAISKLGENIAVRRFMRFQLGETRTNA